MMRKTMNMQQAADFFQNKFKGKVTILPNRDVLESMNSQHTESIECVGNGDNFTTYKVGDEFIQIAACCGHSTKTDEEADLFTDQDYSKYHQCI